MHVSEKTRKQLSTQFQAIIHHSQALLEATTGEIDAKTKEARDKLQESLDAVKDKYQLMEDRLSEGVQTTDRMVHEKPYYAIGATFAAGLLVGLMLRRK
ncbi:MAG: YqjD family protein [Desulfovibrionales bacterium]